MLLIIFFGLIAKLALVSCDCDCEIRGEKGFDWNKVGIGVLKRFLKQEDLKTFAWIYMSFVILLTKY